MATENSTRINSIDRLDANVDAVRAVLHAAAILHGMEVSGTEVTEGSVLGPSTVPSLLHHASQLVNQIEADVRVLEGGI